MNSNTLTKQQIEALNQARTDCFSDIDLGSIKPELLANAAFRSGFEVGLKYQQKRIDAYAAYEAGRITMDELEEVLER